jgi:hypothetical protein
MFIIFLIVGIIVGINWQTTTVEIGGAENITSTFSKLLVRGTAVQFREFLRMVDDLMVSGRHAFCNSIAIPMCMESSQFLTLDALIFCRNLTEQCSK